VDFFKRFSSFTYLNTTQFLGALNDNIFKLLTVFLLISIEGVENSQTILASTGAIFVLPFLLFSASSGTLADRFSKRNIIVLTKIFELVIMSLAVLCFAYESKWGAYLILFLLALQSAVFGPSKYGILPELVSNDKISKANGIMTSFTFLAIITGTFFASFLLDVTSRNFIFASLFCALIALVGMVASFCIAYTPPSGSSQPFNVFFLAEIYSSLKIASQHTSLLMAVFGSAFFLFLGSFVQLNMIPFAVETLHLTDVQGGYLFLLTAIGIGSGAIAAGKLSGKSVELGLVPIAALLVAITCFLIDYFSANLGLELFLIVIVGFFGGMYQIPLDSYIQVASPSKFRGQIVAATNFLSFVGVLLSSGLLIFTKNVLGLTPDSGFTVIGTITLFVAGIIGLQFFDYTARFTGMCLAKVHFKTSLQGEKNIPDRPAVYVCTHTDWNDTLLMLGSQKRRLRFFIEREQEHSKWMKKLYKLLKVVMIPEIEPLEQHPEFVDQIKQNLDRGLSVCIFIADDDLCKALDKLRHLYAIQEMIRENRYPLVPVHIEKGEKSSASDSVLSSWLAKVRVPARISFGESINDPLPPPERPEHAFALDCC